MNSTEQPQPFAVPKGVNFTTLGRGSPVVMIHGLAASLHDWDGLVPELAARGFAAYALDLLGHGDSPKPELPLYRMEWLAGHFEAWIDQLALAEPFVLVGHSLGGYLALEYALKYPARLRGLVLVDPFYSTRQLTLALRLVYHHPSVSMLFLKSSPGWLVRWTIDVTSVLMAHRTGGLHALPPEVRAQTASDYLRTAPASYGVLRDDIDLTPALPLIDLPTLVVWGDRDRTLPPASFAELVRRMPHASGRSSPTGHVPHQSDVDWFNQEVIQFLESLPAR
jgi:pimeloyl-ACP methyl ester carboxylesterase